MKVAVVGGGILGLTLSHRLSQLKHEVDLIEAEPQIGGLACPHDYGPFVWDRFYHCILAQDTSLIALLSELGVAGDLRWTRTGTGYYARGKLHTMSSNADLLRFPLLTIVDKARLAGAVLYATRVAKPDELYGVSAEEWLTRLCGRRGYEAFWQPLLKAKFGPFHDKVAAVFIYATLKRLFGARSAAAGRESLGYVSGGYNRILKAFAERLRLQGVKLWVRSPVLAIEPDESAPSAVSSSGPASNGAQHGGCRVTRRAADGQQIVERYDQVFFTAPTRLARRAVAQTFLPHVEEMERDHPTTSAYLGVACLVLVLEKPLTPYYVLNIGDASVELTGLIEMTNLIDKTQETRGLSLLYLPRYLDSESDELRAGDDALRDGMIERGLKRLFPDYDPARAIYSGIHRARYVQPLPLVRQGGAGSAAVPALTRPFQIVNTSMLRCATLNNNEVVGLVDRFVEKNRDALSG
jgi:protoporphyrinogen oxidase